MDITIHPLPHLICAISFISNYPKCFTRRTHRTMDLLVFVYHLLSDFLVLVQRNPIEQ